MEALGLTATLEQREGQLARVLRRPLKKQLSTSYAIRPCCPAAGSYMGSGASPAVSFVAYFAPEKPAPDTATDVLSLQ